MQDYVQDKSIQALATQLINILPDLRWIADYGYTDSIGYVRSFVKKQSKSNCYADCRKVAATYKAFITYDIIITLYDPLVSQLSENQLKILLWHELKHIRQQTDGKGLAIRDHDVKDFRDILDYVGLDWHEIDEDVPDILQRG